MFYKQIKSHQRITKFKIGEKMPFYKDQLNFILSFSPKALESEKNHGFSPFYYFINVLKNLESNQWELRLAIH